MRSLACAVVLLLTLTAACGDDVAFIFSTNFGVVAGDPDCPGGQFDLRDQQGLIFIVILNSSSTVILANGSRGGCSDLRAGVAVRVRGQQSGDRITASEVRVQ